MAQQTINIGAAANDGTGDPARTAFGKVNDNFTELYAQSGHGVIGSTVTTKQDDYAPDGWSACRTLRWNGAGSTGVTGFDSTDIPDGAERIITNASTDYLLWLENENTASSAANRMALPKGFPAFLMPGDSLTLQYDTTAARWRVIDWPNQGQAMGLVECYDTHTGSSTSFPGGGTSGTGASVSYSASGFTDQTKNAIGCISLKTGTSGTGTAFVGAYQYCGSWDTAAQLVVARMGTTEAPTGTDTYRVEIGLLVSGTSQPTGAFWEYRWGGSAPEVAQSVSAAGSVTRSTTNSPSHVSNDMTWFVVFKNQAGTAVDFIHSGDGVSFSLAQRITTGLPAASETCGPGAQAVHQAGTSSRSAYIDIIGFRSDGARG